MEGPNIFAVGTHSYANIYLCAILKDTHVRISLGYINRNGMVGPQGVRIISFNIKCQTICQSDCMDIHSHQLYVKISAPESIDACPTSTDFLPVYWAWTIFSKRFYILLCWSLTNWGSSHMNLRYVSFLFCEMPIDYPQCIRACAPVFRYAFSHLPRKCVLRNTSSLYILLQSSLVIYVWNIFLQFVVYLFICLINFWRNRKANFNILIFIDPSFYGCMC